MLRRLLLVCRIVAKRSRMSGQNRFKRFSTSLKVDQNSSMSYRMKILRTLDLATSSIISELLSIVQLCAADKFTSQSR